MSRSTTEHTWYEKWVHIPRAGGTRFVRARTGLLTFNDGYIAIQVTFREGGKVKKKLVSPITLGSFQCHWLNRDIVSEDDAADIDYGDMVVLPPLRLVNPFDHTCHQQATFTWVSAQTDVFTYMSTGTEMK
jgi:hypothetical protein